MSVASPDKAPSGAFFYSPMATTVLCKARVGRVIFSTSLHQNGKIMSDEVKKQHYVWEHYLKGWANKDQIWCKRGNSPPFLTSTENVAQERYFYEIQPLNEAEIKLLGRMISKGPVLTQTVNLSSLHAYVALANSNSHHRRFGMELHHSQIEGKVAPLLKALRNGDNSVLEDKQSKIDLCIYLGQQYTRTKRVRNSYSPLPDTVVIPEHYKEVNQENIHRAMAFILANTIGNSLYDLLDLQLVTNETEVKLLTCDQPIFNLLAVPGDLSKEASIYMPISPTYALWAKKGVAEKIDMTDKAESLNRFMVKNSLEFIFASSQAELLAL